MNILFITARSDFGGGPAHLYSLLTNLQRTEFTFYIACPKQEPYYPLFKAQCADLFLLPVRAFSLVKFIQLISFIKQNKIDLIHSHGKGAGLYSRLLGWFTGKPVVHTLHGLHYDQYGALMRSIYFFLERFLTRLSRVIISVSESECAEAIRLGILNQKKAMVIHNGIDIEKCQTRATDRTKKRREFGFSEEHIAIGMVARFDPVKGIDISLEAFAMVRQRFPTAKYLLVGDGELYDDIKMMIHRKGLEANVMMTGFRDDIPALLSIMDILISTSKREGLPLNLLEAMASGLPVVATNVSGNNEVVVDGATGFLVPSGDADALAEKLCFLIEHPEERERLGQRGQERVKQFFSVEGMVKKTSEVYQKVLHGIAK